MFDEVMFESMFGRETVERFQARAAADRAPAIMPLGEKILLAVLCAVGAVSLILAYATYV